MSIILLLISTIFDGALSIYIPNNSYLLPLITVTTIFLIYGFLKKQEKKYYIQIIITGIIYDLLYTNLLFFHAIIFLFLGIITKHIYKNFTLNYLKLIIYIIAIIVFYETLTSTILFLFRIVPITLSKLTYKITHSILINVIYAEIIYLIINKLKKS